MQLPSVMSKAFCVDIEKKKDGNFIAENKYGKLYILLPSLGTSKKIPQCLAISEHRNELYTRQNKISPLHPDNSSTNNDNEV